MLILKWPPFFPSPYSRVKKRANFKTNIHLYSVESFLYYLSSSEADVESQFLRLTSGPIEMLMQSMAVSMKNS